MSDPLKISVLQGKEEHFKLVTSKADISFVRKMYLKSSFEF